MDHVFLAIRWTHDLASGDIGFYAYAVVPAEGEVRQGDNLAEPLFSKESDPAYAGGAAALNCIETGRTVIVWSVIEHIHGRKSVPAAEGDYPGTLNIQAGAYDGKTYTRAANADQLAALNAVRSRRNIETTANRPEKGTAEDAILRAVRDRADSLPKQWKQWPSA